MKKINLEEILNKHHHLYMPYNVRDTEGKFRSVIDKDGAVEAMKEACKQALELAAENAKTVTWYDAADNEYSEIVDRSSIRNIINQIE